MPGVRGLVTDEEDKPLGNIIILLNPESDTPIARMNFKDGKYEITDLVAGQDYQMAIIPTYPEYKAVRGRFDAIADVGDQTMWVVRDFKLEKTQKG